jgi:hypothetical protein
MELRTDPPSIWERLATGHRKGRPKQIKRRTNLLLNLTRLVTRCRKGGLERSQDILRTQRWHDPMSWIVWTMRMNCLTTRPRMWTNILVNLTVAITLLGWLACCVSYIVYTRVRSIGQLSSLICGKLRRRAHMPASGIGSVWIAFKVGRQRDQIQNVGID